MGKLSAERLIADFQRMLADGWGYIPGTSGVLWTQAMQDKSADSQVKKYGGQWVGHRVADCSGAFVYAFRQQGLSIYHGSNRIARVYVEELLPIAEAKPGMAAFKAYPPGHKYYSLPAEYKPGGAYYNGDLNDYYHIGLVDGDGKTVINAQSTRTGVVRSGLDGSWSCVARLKQISDEEEMPVETLYRAVVTAENGKPVNLRKAAAISAARICTVPVGTEVDVLSETDADWAQIRYGEKTGYMMRKYLRREEEHAPDQRLEQLRELLRQALSLADGMLEG